MGLETIGAVVEMGILSTLKRLHMESSCYLALASSSTTDTREPGSSSSAPRVNSHSASRTTLLYPWDEQLPNLLPAIIHTIEHSKLMLVKC
jgi:hypothetical protein